jgi:Tol biopolymer transport system component
MADAVYTSVVRRLLTATTTALLVTTVLTSAPATAVEDTLPVLPAGRLAFSTALHEQDGSGAGSITLHGLGTMRLDGTDQRTLTSPAAQTYDSGPDWSPDGRWLVNGRSPDPWEIRITSADGQRSTAVGEGRFPVWSPDGRTIAYASLDPARPGLVLLAVDATGDEAVTDPANARLLPLPRPAGASAWSPDGRSLAIWISRSDDSQRRDLWHLTVATGQLQQLSSNVWQEHSIRPSWHPTGTLLAFVAEELEHPGAPQAWLVRPDGTQQTRLRPYDGRYHNWVSWAPHGLSLALSSNLFADGVLVVSPTGQILQRLGGSLFSGAESPVWSPDATHLYTVADKAGGEYRPELWALSALGDGTARALTNDSSVFPYTSTAVDPGLALRVFGTSIAATAVAVADQLPDSSTVVLTTTASAPAATPLAARLQAPLLQTHTQSLPGETQRALKDRSPTAAWLVGQVSDTVETQLRELGVTTVHRLGGSDESAVAAAVAEHVPATTVFMAPSEGPVEQAASAAVAGAREAPLLLTGNSALGSSTREALRRVGASQVHLTASFAVSNAVDDELRSMGIGVNRLGGADGAAAALSLAEAYAPFASMDRPVVVPESSPDIGGPMLAASRSTVLLPAGEDASDPVVHFISAHSDAIAGVDMLAPSRDLTPALETAIERSAHDPNYQPPAAPPAQPAPTVPAEPTQPTAPNGPAARSIEQACPSGRVPANPFRDVATGSTHERAISCLVWWQVANGRTATSYAPSAGVTRDAMAAFVARTILKAKPGSLPDNPADAFGDDNGSVHHKAINQLAAVGIVGGTGGGSYSPSAGVTRGQMAKFLANAVKHVLGQPLTVDRDLFSDDNSSLFQDDINRVAQAGLTGGRADGTYGPLGPVLRDQMGSFLARTLDLFVANGARLPG